MSDLSEEQLKEISRVLDEAAVPDDHRMLYDPETHLVICSCGKYNLYANLSRSDDDESIA